MKRFLSKVEELRRLRFILKLCAISILVLLMTIVALVTVLTKVGLVSHLGGKMSVMTQEEYCLEFHNRTLEDDGYCDITPVGRNEGNFRNYFVCSWGKLIVDGEEYEGGPRNWYYMWQTDCEFEKAVKVIM